MSDFGNAKYVGDVNTRKVFYHYNNGAEKIEITPAISQTVFNHSPDGFSWGYTGSGPAQLALAILLDLEDMTIAIKLYQKFKREVVAKWATDRDFEIALVDILKWIDNELDNENENLASTAKVS